MSAHSCGYFHPCLKHFVAPPAIAQIPLPSRLSSSPRPATCLRNVRTTCPKSSSLVESAPQRRQTYQRVHQWSQQAEAEAVLPQPHQATKRSWEVWDGYSVRIHVAVTLTSTMHWHACSRAAGSFFSKHAPRTTCRCCRMRGTRAQCRMHPCRCCSLVCCRVWRMGPSGTCTQWLPGSGCKETLCEPRWHLHHEKARFFFASHPATLACAWLCCFSLLFALVQVHLHSTNSEASDTERKNDGQARATAPWISETHQGNGCPQVTFCNTCCKHPTRGSL